MPLMSSASTVGSTESAARAFPRCHDSGGTSRLGHINRKSRELARTMLTQSIYQAIKGTPSWQRQYDELKEGRGSGRAKIAMMRRLCGVMRRMLLEGEQELYQRNLRQYPAVLEHNQRSQDAALDGRHRGLPATTDLGLRGQLVGIARNKTERGGPPLQICRNHTLARAAQVEAHVSFCVVPAAAEHRLDDPEVILSGSDFDIGAPLAYIPGEHRDVAQFLVEVEENAVVGRRCQEIVELATQVHSRPRVLLHVDIAELVSKPQ